MWEAILLPPSSASIPCTVPNTSHGKISVIPPENFYDNLKIHIGNLPIIQLGLTLFNSNQELPVIEGHPSIWLFHFNMSDSCYSPKALSKSSLERLELYGVDLEMNRKNGVDPVSFRDIIFFSLLCEKKVTAWISFTGMYDFGYLIKMFTGKGVFPETLEELLGKTRFFFGEVYDVKNMAESVGLYGSLEEVSEAIRVDRVAEREANAGFDGYLTMQVFMRMKTLPRFRDGVEFIIGKFRGLRM